LSYTSPGFAGSFTQKLATFGRAILGSVLGTAIFIAQATTDLVTYLARIPALAALVLGLALITLTFTQGLVGLELLLMLLPFVRWWWRFIEQPSSGHVIARVTDSVTGRPIPLVLATVTGPGGYSIISDFAGHLHLPTKLAATRLKLSRPGYQPIDTTHSDHLILEPVPGSTSLKRICIDLLLGVTAWVLLALATLTSFALAFTHPSFLGSVLAIIFSLIVVVNVLLLRSRPGLKWGHVADAANGRLLRGATIKLAATGQEVNSQYLTRADGRYTLHAPVGEYDIVVSCPGYKTYQEHVTIRWREAYLGFNLHLTHE
jgi:hypothetical protein